MARQAAASRAGSITFVRLFGWLVLTLAFAPEAARAVGSADALFSAEALPVDATARSAALARDVALADGQRRGVDQVLKRLVLRADQDFLPELSDEQISHLVQDISITNERTSSIRYLANLTVRFKKEAIRDLLRNQGIRYAETISKARLVIPLYEAAGAQILWDEPNPWRAAWEDREADPASPVPLMMPRGDLGDVAAIGAAQVLAGDDRRIEAIGQRYDVTDVLVAHARLEVDLAANRPRLHVTLRQLGPAGEGVVLLSFTGEARDRVPELLVRAVAESVVRLEEDWKHDNLLQFDSPVRLSVRIPLSSLAEWLSVRGRLESSAVVRRVELAALSRADAQVVLHYLGDPAQLTLALAQIDLDLREEDGFWTLSLRSGEPVPATTEDRESQDEGG